MFFHNDLLGKCKFLISKLVYEVSKGTRRQEILGTVSFLLPTHFTLALRSQAISGSHLTSLLRTVLGVHRGYLRSHFLRSLLAEDGTPFCLH